MKTKIISPLSTEKAFLVNATSVIECGKLEGHPYEIAMAIFHNLDPAISFCKDELAFLPEGFCYEIKIGLLDKSYLGVTVAKVLSNGDTTIFQQFLDLV